MIIPLISFGMAPKLDPPYGTADKGCRRSLVAIPSNLVLLGRFNFRLESSRNPVVMLLPLELGTADTNAVDKVIGWALLENHLPLSEYVLVVSGRGGFEIVQKAIVAGVPVVAAVSAPSSLAVRLARELDLTLVGFSRGKRFVVYAGGRRLGLTETTTNAE